MGRLETELIDFPCKKLGDIAHVVVEYFYSKGHKSLAGFKCKGAADCGVSLSPFSGTFNYTIYCPLYIELEKNLK